MGVDTRCMGLGDDQHGPSPRRSEGAQQNRPEGMFFMLMPIGFVNTLLPLIQDGEQAELQIVFPLTMLLYIALGGLMLSGNIEEPGGE